MSARLLLCVLLSAVAPAAVTGLQTAERQPAVAVVVVSPGPLREGKVLPLLEDLLAGSGRMRLLDRQLIDRVLAEQEIAGLLGTASAGGRVALGRLIQADVLVLLRSNEAADNTVGVVVAETSQGLQLLSERVTADGGEEKTAGRLHGAVLAAVGKYHEGIRVIAAVPSFASDDPTFVNDALRAVYARYVEQVLLRVPGVQVVDLHEADAVSQERTLALAGGGIERPLPLYVDGRFRCQDGGQPRVSLSLSARRGKLPLGTPLTTNVPTSEGTAALRQAALALLARLDGTSSEPPSDPAAELSELGSRADAFFMAGFLDEALPLYGACALLAPDATAYPLMLARCRLSHVPAVTRLLTPHTFPTAARELRLAFGDLTHALLVTAPPDVQRQAIDALVEFDQRLSAMAKTAHRSYTFFEQEHDLDALMREKSAFYIAYLRSRIGAAAPTDTFRLPAASLPLAAIGDEPDLVTRYRLALKLKHGPTAALLLRQAPSLAVETEAHRREFLARMEATVPGDPDLREAVRVAREVANATGSQNGDGIRVAGPARAGTAGVPVTAIRDDDATTRVRLSFATAGAPPAATSSFSRITFRWASGLPVTNNADLEICNWLAVSTIDVLCGRHALYVMRTPGVLERLAATTTGTIRCDAVQYDGRWIWVPVAGEATEVWAVDPVNGQRIVFRTTDGLMPSSAGIAAQPVGNGQCCVSGAFRKEKWTRSWIAWLKAGEPATNRVEVIHLALDLAAGSGANLTPEADADIGFVPVGMQWLESESDPAEHRIVLARSQMTLAELTDTTTGANIDRDARLGGAHVSMRIGFETNAVSPRSDTRVQMIPADLSRFRAVTTIDDPVVTPDKTPQIIGAAVDAASPTLMDVKLAHHDLLQPRPLLIDPLTRRVRVLPNGILPGFAPAAVFASAGGRQQPDPALPLPGKRERVLFASASYGSVLLTGANPVQRPFFREFWLPAAGAVTNPQAAPAHVAPKPVVDPEWVLVDDLVNAYREGTMPRHHILEVLNQLGPRASSAVPFLTEAVANTEEWDIAMLAARALGSIGAPAFGALPELRRLAATEQTDRAANRWAADAVAAIEGTDGSRP